MIKDLRVDVLLRDVDSSTSFCSRSVNADLVCLTISSVSSELSAALAVDTFG